MAHCRHLYELQYLMMQQTLPAVCPTHFVRVSAIAPGKVLIFHTEVLRCGVPLHECSGHPLTGHCVLLQCLDMQMQKLSCCSALSSGLGCPHTMLLTVLWLQLSFVPPKASCASCSEGQWPGLLQLIDCSASECCWQHIHQHFMDCAGVSKHCSP